MSEYRTLGQRELAEDPRQLVLPPGCDLTYQILAGRLGHLRRPCPPEISQYRQDPELRQGHRPVEDIQASQRNARTRVATARASAAIRVCGLTRRRSSQPPCPLAGWQAARFP